jgi:Spore Coat Protein U domain
MLNLAKATAAVVVAGLTIPSAEAGVVSAGSFTVSITISGGCAVTTPDTTNINFGAYGYTTAGPSVGTNPTNSVQVLCTNSTPYMLRAAGTTPTGSTTYNMANASAENIPYTISAAYPSATAQSLVNSATPAGAITGGVGTAAAQTIALTYALGAWPFASSAPHPGVFTDNVTLNVDF